MNNLLIKFKNIFRGWINIRPHEIRLVKMRYLV